MQKTVPYKKIIKGNLASVFSFINLGFIQGSNALIQILLIPIITRIVGLAEFGHIMVANSFAALLSLFINYGSNQSGVKDVALNKGNAEALSESFHTIFLTRLLFFFFSVIVLLILDHYGFSNSKYFIPAMAIVLAETVNPFFFFVGLQKLFLYNIANLAAKICGALLIIFLVNSPAKSEWVNFYLGIPSAILYFCLCIYIIRHYRLYHFGHALSRLYTYLGHNFYLTGNNMSVQLQQSFFLFAVSTTDNALVLGAYSLCDKIVWSFRMLIISFSNAIYPKATLVYHADKEKWARYKRKLNFSLFILFTGAAAILFLFAPWIVLIITRGNNPLAILYIRSVCLVPLVAALNSLNVIDLLMRNKYRYIFIIALILLSISITVSEIFMKINNSYLFGYYPIIVEIFSLPLYFIFIRRSNNHLMGK